MQTSPSSASHPPLLILSSDKYWGVLCDLLVHLSFKKISRHPVYALVNTSECATRLGTAFATSTKQAAFPLQPTILASGTPCWADSLRFALDHITNDGYNQLIVLLEDFFVSQIDYHSLEYYCELDHDILYLGPRPPISYYSTVVIEGKPESKDYTIGIIKPFHKYAISLQPALWKIESIIKYLDFNRGTIKTPWQFERSSNGTTLKKLYRSPRPIIRYDDQAVEKGEWYPIKALKYRRVSTLPVMKLGRYTFILIKHFFSKSREVYYAWLAMLRS